MITRRLTTGGSAGLRATTQESSKFEDRKRIDMFKVQGLYPMFPRKDSNVRGFILPSFDKSLDPKDTTFPMSVSPYRDRTAIDPGTNMPEFTSWISFVNGYAYYGKNMSTFVSPAMQEGRIDPIKMLRDAVFKMGDRGDYRYQYLKEKKSKDDIIALPARAHLALLNVWSTNTNTRAKDANEWKNRVLCLRVTAYDHLLKQLSAMRPATMPEAVDPDWAAFLLGDVTNPARAMEFHFGEAIAESTKNPAAVVEFGQLQTDFNTGTSHYQCNRQALTDKILAGRYDFDDTNILHVPTTEEVLELLVEEELVPYELIVEVCSNFADIPPRKGTYKVMPPVAQPPAHTPAPAPVQTPAPMPAAPRPAVVPAWATATTPAQTPAPMPVTPQPTAAPSWASAPANPMLREDPNDDIPMGNTPAPAATGNKLTAEEQQELNDLMQRLAESVDSLCMEEVKRLQDLNAKQRAK
jgi:hypothetical protein